MKTCCLGGTRSSLSSHTQSMPLSCRCHVLLRLPTMRIQVTRHLAYLAQEAARTDDNIHNNLPHRQTLYTTMNPLPPLPPPAKEKKEQPPTPGTPHTHTHTHTQYSQPTHSYYTLPLLHRKAAIQPAGQLNRRTYGELGHYLPTYLPTYLPQTN